MAAEVLIIVGTLVASALSLGSLILRDQQLAREELGRLLSQARQLADALGAGPPRLLPEWGHNAWEIEAERGGLKLLLHLYRLDALHVTVMAPGLVPPGVVIHALTSWRDAPLDLPVSAPLVPLPDHPFAADYHVSPAGAEPQITAALREALARWRGAPVYINASVVRAAGALTSHDDALAFVDACVALARHS
jgi:hypothetical protein